MRSPNKSRSRNKNQNRRNNPTNVINRVFDSSGPEGKVRGTPQQIIDKYQTLARDAQLAGDRVATENFLQHSEHYTRLLNEAMAEQAQRREAQEAQQRRDNGNGNANEAPNTNNNQNQQNAQNRQQPQNRDQTPKGSGDRSSVDPSEQPQPDIIATNADTVDASALVETPEGKAPPKRRSRAKKPVTDATEAPGPEQAAE